MGEDPEDDGRESTDPENDERLQMVPPRDAGETGQKVRLTPRPPATPPPGVAKALIEVKKEE
eukprot:9419241-Alexandrium_andersonii.AAC.1